MATSDDVAPVLARAGATAAMSDEPRANQAAREGWIARAGLAAWAEVTGD
ncbi:MAG: hypothetical protein R3B06_06505 [Kofleriaceae bacterium]